jgi:hypothetical protein
MQKIRWTAHERNIVIEGAIQHYNSGGYTPLAAIRQAQMLLLTADRRRNFAGHSAAIDLIREVKEKALQKLAKNTDERILGKQKLNEPAPIEVPQTNTPAGLLDDLVASIAQRFVAGLKEQVRIAVKELEHEFKVEKHNPTYQQTGKVLPRVVIVGLLGDQAYNITKEFAHSYDIRCIDADRAMSMTPPDAAAYLLMKNFISHSLFDKYQVFPNHVLIDGGMSTLRMWLSTKGKEL